MTLILFTTDKPPEVIPHVIGVEREQDDDYRPVLRITFGRTASTLDVPLRTFIKAELIQELS